MIKSPLRYPGGKSRGINFLSRFIPPFAELREAFFGGGSLSFYSVQHYKNKLYNASDLNYELYCFWSQLKNNSSQLIDGVQQIYNTYKVSETTNSADSHAGKKIFNLILERRNDALSELQRAIDFFVLNRITFSGVVDSGGYSEGSFSGRFTQSSIERLRDAIMVVKNINFFCEDFSYLVNKPGKDVFIFLDPPYHAATKSKLYGKNGILHTSFNHVALFEALKDCPHKWLITYDNSEYIRELYQGFNQLSWQLQYGMTNSTSMAGNELLISNYDLKDLEAVTGKTEEILKKKKIVNPLQ